MYIVEEGQISLIDPTHKMRTTQRFRENDAFGSKSFLTGAHHSMTAVADTETTVWVLRKQDFEQLLLECPKFKSNLQSYLQQTEIIRYLKNQLQIDSDKIAKWTQKTVKKMQTKHLPPSAVELMPKLGGHAGAPIAIWVGIFLDGIPESIVIGSNMIGTGKVSLSLIVGLFLSNYPEALSSSVGMRSQGYSFIKVLLMWTSLMLFTGIGAAMGNLFFAGAPATLFSIIEGIAAGAMLTMIADTMLPEAYLKGGNIVGISTLLGFLAAIFSKTLEG